MSTFPIVEVQGNRLISKEGNIGHFYALNPPDMEQMDHIQVNHYLARISKSLNQLGSSFYYKFYCISGQYYLETNSSDLLDLSQIELEKCERPLEIFFGQRQIFSDIGIYDDYLSYNGKYVRILSTLEFSNDLIDGPLCPQGVDYVLIVKKMSKDRAIKRLERVRSGHLSSFMKMKRDLSSESAYSQAEELLGEVIQSEESLFKMELYFLLKDESLSALNRKTTSFYHEMLSRGVAIFSEGQSLKKKKTGLATLFNELIPGVKPSLSMRMHLNKSSHLRYLLPINKSFLTKEGITFHDVYDSEVNFHIFLKKFKNRNMLVSGMSGVGKSVFVNKMIHHLVPDHPTVILDKGGSYKRLALYHEGFELKNGFNPFHFKDPLYLRELILSVIDQKDFDSLQRGKLLFEIKRLLPDVNSFQELLTELEEKFVGIKYYFEEFKEYLTNDPMIESKILYVDIENLPKGIISPMIIYILEYFKNISKSEKILVFDECWEYLEKHASFVGQCFRTFRKTGAFAIAISQSLHDFTGKDGKLDGIYTAITNNSYFSVLFPQETQRLKDLTEFDVSRMESLEFEKGIFSECYLKSKDNVIRKVIRNYLTPLEFEIAHTDHGEDERLLRFISTFRTFFGTTAQTIDSFVRLKYESSNDYHLFNSLAEDSLC